MGYIVAGLNVGGGNNFVLNFHLRREGLHNTDCDSHLNPSETLLLNETLLPTAPIVGENEGYKAECFLPLADLVAIIIIQLQTYVMGTSHPYPNPWDLRIYHLAW